MPRPVGAPRPASPPSNPQPSPPSQPSQPFDFPPPRTPKMNPEHNREFYSAHSNRKKETNS